MTMRMAELTERAKAQMAELTGLKPMTITSASRDGQGWCIALEMLEMSRVPPSTDILGNYEVVMDDDGNLLRFERKGTRLRGEPIQREAKV